MSLGTHSKSWWLENGPGCYLTDENWADSVTPTASDPTSRQIPPEDIVAGCLLDYYYVEIIHAGVQCLLCVSMPFSLLIFILAVERAVLD